MSLRWICLVLLGSSAFALGASPEAVRGEHAMVASRSMLASEVGADMMRGGGNAIDGAVATAFALAVTYPAAGNIGGGGFMVIRLANGKVVTNDHREKAPAAARRDMYLDKNGNVVQGLSTNSRLAVGVPGSVDGLLDVLSRYGTLPRQKIIAPAIKLARDGFVVNYDLAREFQAAAEQFRRYPGSAKAYLKADGSPYREGDVFRQPELAKTLELISAKGRDGFYAGKTAELIVAEMQRGGGLITLDDLKNYHSVWRAPIEGEYRGYRVYSMAPPSSGGVLLVQMLNMLEPYDLHSLGYGSAATIHLMVEAERRAYADRAQYLGDPDFYHVPVAELTSKAYAKKRFADFDPDHASPSSAIGPGLGHEDLETTHVSVMDAAGNSVALTTTLNLLFGCKIAVAGAGFLLNNEMDDFSSKENTPNSFGLIGREANAIAPNKRMLSSMTPTIVVDPNGSTVLVTGSPGGSTIITTVLQVVVNVIDHQMDVADAVSEPRFHHQWLPDRVMYEPYGISPDTLKILRKQGYTLVPVQWGRGTIGDANSVMRIGDVLFGEPDPREQGGAAGF